MKIRKVAINNRRKAFEVVTARGTHAFPFAKLRLKPSSTDKIVRVSVDPELANEAFTYVLDSGAEDSVHIDDVLNYNQDPSYMRDLLLYKLTVEAQKRVKASPLSRRELIRRLGTSATQFYRILDQTNYRKSIDQVLALLRVLDCEVEFVLKDKAA